jgi:hypothetical protein
MAGSVTDHQRVRRFNTKLFQGYPEDPAVGLLDAMLV